MARWAKTTLCSPEEVITRWPLAGQVNTDGWRRNRKQWRVRLWELTRQPTTRHSQIQSPLPILSEPLLSNAWERAKASR